MAEAQLEVRVLNSEPENCSNTTLVAHGGEISEQLQKAMLRMTGKFLNEVTGNVDYESLSNSSEFREYCVLASSLKLVSLSSFSEEELIAFFINVYNTLTVHSICEIQKTSNISTALDIPNFWRSYVYEIDKWTFSLDDIEHGILRGNRPHPTSGQPLLKADDTRLQYSCKHFDARVHFALNCGAKSCPVIRVYKKSNLENALEAATRSYLNQGVHIEERDGVLKVPQILQWYQHDFAEDQRGVLKWIEPYVQPSVQQAINSIMATEEDVASKIHYHYDWTLNKA